MNLRLSKKYGVNPTILICPACGKETRIALLGANGGKQAPKYSLDINLCDDCTKVVKEDKTFILCAKHTSDGPKITGQYVIVPNSYLNIPVPSMGFCFMEETEFNKFNKPNETN